MSLDTLLVALILIVELIDVAHHWKRNEAHTQAPRCCTDCLDCLARSLRSAGASPPPRPIRANSNDNSTPFHPDTEEECAADNADSTSETETNTDCTARSASAFLRDQHRHVRQPFDSRWIGLR